MELEDKKMFRSEKEKIIKDIKQAVKEINLIKSGKKKARNTEEFIYELQG